MPVTECHHPICDISRQSPEFCCCRISVAVIKSVVSGLLGHRRSPVSLYALVSRVGYSIDTHIERKTSDQSCFEGGLPSASCASLNDLSLPICSDHSRSRSCISNCKILAPGVVHIRRVISDKYNL